ncbi:MAG: 3-deoxy-7-phosphoheptulonate synthase [Acidobacteria bacterium]|nr:3-deoxy-7-phosphoheptulonate synthase [Acidobacteriota bacterium]MBI3658773.1 3-deoxy-7-phosphoheptulonate synthase [Acidobacteriota bacterium]
MVVVMCREADEAQIAKVIERLTEQGFDVHRSTGVERTVLGAVGGKIVDHRSYELLEGVAEVVRITQPFKLSHRSFKPEETTIIVPSNSRNGSGLVIGRKEVMIMAGPCSVENREQVLTIAGKVRAAGARVLRGGAFKPRTSPYSFQGLGEEGLRYLREAADANKMLVISEVMDQTQIPMMLDYVDILQVGARNMQNYTLLKQLGQVRKPVMLKRGMAATIEEWLLSAEYIMTGGNHEVILCERGIRTFENLTRNTLDLLAVPVVHSLSHLPIVVDPSHGTGRRDKVIPMARAALAAGADGLMLEVHHDPDHALSDGAQSLFPEQFTTLMGELRRMAPVIGRVVY